MPEEPTRLAIPSPDARSAMRPFGARIDDVAFFSTGGLAATGVLDLTGLPLNTETVVIDGKTYTFQTVLTDVDGNVLIGASASDSIDNLIAAITLGAGSGTLYAASTTLHPTVTAAAGAGDTMDATAKSKGTAGNALTTTETLTNGSWTSGATLAGGTDTDAEVVFIPVVQWASMRLRFRVTGSGGTINVAFARPARDKKPNTDGTAFVYTVDNPAIDATAWVSATELSLEITNVEHQGENWLKLSLTSDSEDGVVDFCDISGELFGNFH